MAFKTTLFAAATAAHFVQLDGRDVLRPVRVCSGELCCVLGQDDEWTIPDQEIEVDESGVAQVKVREYHGAPLMVRPVRFLTTQPRVASDMLAAG